jgi:hypothetical protein
VHFVCRDASAFALLGAPIPFDGGFHPLLSPGGLKLCLFTTGGRTPQAEVSMIRHVGGLSPGELSHSLTCEAVSSWRAFLIRLSRRAQGRINLASSRKRLASLVRRCSSDMVCLTRRRFCICELRSVRIYGASRSWAPVRVPSLTYVNSIGNLNRNGFRAQMARLESRAFSSEVASGSHEENASKQK